MPSVFFLYSYKRESDTWHVLCILTALIPFHHEDDCDSTEMWIISYIFYFPTFGLNQIPVLYK